MFVSSQPVVETAADVMRLLAVILPMDAINFGVEGILIGGMQAGYMARCWAATSICGMVVLHIPGNPFTGSLLSIWLLMEITAATTLVLLILRMISPKSPLESLPDEETIKLGGAEG